MRTRFQRKAPVAFQPQNVVLSAFSRMKNHSDPASHALLNYPLRPLIISGSPPRILRIVLAQPRRLLQPARTSAFQTSFGDGCDSSTRRKVCTNGCTVTGDSVSEDFPISPPPSVARYRYIPREVEFRPLQAHNFLFGRLNARAPAPQQKEGRQSWKTASPR